MKKLVLTIAALSALAACSNPEPMAPMATQQPTVVMAEPTMNKL